MKSLIMYDEFGSGMGLPSIKDDFQAEKYENQDTIIKYLKNGVVKGVQANSSIDCVTGERISTKKVFMNDGVYSWHSILIYYIEKYNLRLSKDFEEYVLNKVS